MQQLPLACFLSLIRPPGITFEDSFLQILPVDKAKCPFVRDHSDITIRLYTRHNPVVYQELNIDDDESLFASNMDFNDPTVMYFTAFLEQPDDGSGLSVREAYMLRGDTNFIIFDLSRLEAGPWYFTAAENTWYIGNFAAKFIDYLVSRGLDLKKLHLVGHSLGAQSAGVAGAVIKTGRISRITGLDPAFPLFDKLPLTQRLDPSDAEFVDVIHTDAGIFGFNRPTGHVDFYPNGGISPQPGCELEVVLHEQRLLNNCDGGSKALGYYMFYLDTNKKQNRLEDNIIQFFQYINDLKKSNASKRNKGLQELNTEVLKQYTETKESAHLKNDSDNKKDNTVKYYETKQHHLKQNPRFEKQKTNTPKQSKVKTNKELTTSGILSTLDSSTYIREKRISVVDNTETIENTENINTPTAELKNQQENVNENTKPTGIQNNNNTEDINQNTVIGRDLPIDADTKIVQNTTNTQRNVLTRHKRFISLFRNNNDNNEDNFLLKMLEFLVKNRKNVIPVVTVMREINTLVKSANGELNHSSKEKNNFIGTPPQLIPITYDLELGNDSRAMAFIKRLLGLGVRGGKLTINGSGK